MKTKITLTFFISLIAFNINAQISQETYIVQVKPYKSDLWGYANQKGEIIIKPQYLICSEFSSEGFASVQSIDNEQYYFIDKKGLKLSTEITSFKLPGHESYGIGFRNIKGFKNGLVAILKDNKWGYLNTSGKLFIPMKYDIASEFKDGYAIVKSMNKYMVLNTKGEEFVVQGSEEFIIVRPFYDGLAAFRAKNKKWGFIGTDGKIAIEATYEHVNNFSTGLVSVKTDDKKVGYINTKGEWIINPQFTYGDEFDSESGLARIKNKEKKGYVNKLGVITYISPNPESSWCDFSEGLAEWKKGDLVGFYNNKMEWAIQPQFKDVRAFKNGFAAARIDDKWGIIDKEGKWIIQPTFESIKDFELVK